MKQPDDRDIIEARAKHPDGTLRYERVRQDRRTYYRLLLNDRVGGLTDAKHARETIVYWRSKGWLEEA